MKETLKNKKVVYTIIGIVSVLLVALAVTYAYWLVTKTQTDENVISSACLDISISGEKNDITLTNQFPMSDEDGMKLTPYEFTVTNNCNTSVDYQVVLEAIGEESTAISASSLKVALNDTVTLLSNNAEIDATTSGAYESRRLGFSRLSAKGTEGASDTYELRIWIDANAPISEANKTFRSKVSVTVGQGIESAYEEGTLAYSILANYGGTGATSEIDANELDHRITTSGNHYISTSSNYYYGTEYTFDKATGKYTLSGTLTYATLEECRNGYKTTDKNCVWNEEIDDFECDKVPLECGKYTFKSSSSTYSATTLHEVTDFQSSGGYFTANTWKYTNIFGATTKSNDVGLYKTQDDLGNSYYFRGAAINNYVEFGTYVEDTTLIVYDHNEWTEKTVEVKAGDPMYWRIVRINGDGSVRLVYDGVEKAANGVAHTATIAHTAYNTKYDAAKYVGYTYDDGTGKQVDSTIKGVVDAWYDKHLEATYGTYIADGIFCNDRQVTSGSEEYPIYGAYDRLSSNKAPKLTCTNKSDRYTVEDTINGNGLLSNPVGLITADEVMFAGGATGSNNTYYLYSNEAYRTSTPCDFSDGDAFMVRVQYNGAIGAFSVTLDSDGVRPVINLKADVEFTGDGSFETPYKIVTE